MVGHEYIKVTKHTPRPGEQKPKGRKVYLDETSLATSRRISQVMLGRQRAILDGRKKESVAQKIVYGSIRSREIKLQ